MFPQNVTKSFPRLLSYMYKYFRDTLIPSRLDDNRFRPSCTQTIIVEHVVDRKPARAIVFLSLFYTDFSNMAEPKLTIE